MQYQIYFGTIHVHFARKHLNTFKILLIIFEKYINSPTFLQGVCYELHAVKSTS